MGLRSELAWEYVNFIKLKISQFLGLNNCTWLASFFFFFLNRWFAHFPLPVNKFAFLFLFWWHVQTSQMRQEKATWRPVGTWRWLLFDFSFSYKTQRRVNLVWTLCEQTWIRNYLCTNVWNLNMSHCISLEKGWKWACSPRCHVSITANWIWSQ